MPLNKYNGFSLRNRIFWGFICISFLCMLSSFGLTYWILRNFMISESLTDMQTKTNALMASLDYAVSREPISTAQIPEMLENKLMEIADINKQDIVIYDLQGNFLISNKERSLVPQQKIPPDVLQKINHSHDRVDVREYDNIVKANKTSSYTKLQNNLLQPIGIVYQPFYHNENAYVDLINKYLLYLIGLNIPLIILSIWLSWVISRNLTRAITRFSESITRITLFDTEMRPIKYYHNDELGALVKAYNKMILQIQDQKERLAFSEKEKAWREMAKQVAHEVKNPLTPMRLTIQNFQRKFDPADPKVHEKVNALTQTMVEQIDLIASVAGAFSEFAQLPTPNNETFDLREETEKILRIFSDDKVFLHSNRDRIPVRMDRIYYSRIITNLVKNATEARPDDRELIVNVDLEALNKRITITVEDNGTGIPPEIVGNIFEPNFTSKNSGMGLGLTMVRKMVEEYHGEISVQSEQGRGTRFLISLPSNT